MLVGAQQHGVNEELHKDVEGNKQQKDKTQDSGHHTVQEEPAKEVYKPSVLSEQNKKRAPSINTWRLYIVAFESQQGKKTSLHLIKNG